MVATRGVMASSVFFLQDFQVFFFTISVPPYHHLLRFSLIKHQVMERLNPVEGVPAEIGREVGAPVTLFHYGGPILQANQRFIDGSRLLHHLDHVINAPDGRSPKLLLEKVERLVGCEFGMAHKHEADFDVCVEASHDTPQEVLHNEPVWHCCVLC